MSEESPGRRLRRRLAIVSAVVCTMALVATAALLGTRPRAAQEDRAAGAAADVQVASRTSTPGRGHSPVPSAGMPAAGATGTPGTPQTPSTGEAAAEERDAIGPDAARYDAAGAPTGPRAGGSASTGGGGGTPAPADEPPASAGPAPSASPSVTTPEETAPPAEPADPDEGSASIDPAFLPAPRLGFYDTTADGSPRSVRDDLDGDLQGQVQLAQTHTIDPAGNAAQEMPTLVAHRAALLLFTPQAPTTGVTVTVTVDGEVVAELPLAHPNLLPRSDMNLDGGREDVAYSTRAWSVELPWDAVTPGMALELTTAEGRSGTLAASGIQMAAPTEMVITNLRLGMLTDHPTDSNHHMFLEPERSAADYFQTIPVSRLVMARYEPVRLDRVIVASGTIYDRTADPAVTSSTTGDVYSGDLRENVAKAQVATGINHAGFGVTSAPMNQVNRPTYNQRVIHHARGLYANGVVTHGLSGGNGMATLLSSRGNELSHELGHSYGLGHYPGTDTSTTGDARVIHSSHHADSGWGWIAYRDRMRSNLRGTGAFDPLGSSFPAGRMSQTYAGMFNYHADTMAGGSNTSTLSAYTHMTGYSTKRAQQNLRTTVPDLSYPSGYRDWDPAAGAWIDARVKNPAFTAPRPAAVGVPVFTLLGGYTPDAPERTVLYPAFRSNYGNVFAPVTPVPAANGRTCWVAVTYADGTVERFGLDAGNGTKQLNINVAQDDRPAGATVACAQGGTTTQMDTISIATDLAPMEPATTIGQEEGYEALRRVEVAELDDALTPLAGRSAPVVDARTAVLLDSWEDDLSGLSPAATQVAERVLELRDAAARVDAYVVQHRAGLDDGDATAAAGLRALLTDVGFVEPDGEVLPDGGNLTVDGGRCLAVASAQAPGTPFTVAPGECADTPEQRWLMDARGAIHSAARPDLCLVSRGLAPCDARAQAQAWVPESDGHLRNGATGTYLDLHRAQDVVGLYPRTNGQNQIWRGLVVAQSPALAVLDRGSLTALAEAAAEA